MENRFKNRKLILSLENLVPGMIVLRKGHGDSKRLDDPIESFPIVVYASDQMSLVDVATVDGSFVHQYTEFPSEYDRERVMYDRFWIMGHCREYYTREQLLCCASPQVRRFALEYFK